MRCPGLHTYIHTDTYIHSYLHTYLHSYIYIHTLCGSVCPGIHSVDLAGLELMESPAFASQVLGLKTCGQPCPATTPSLAGSAFASLPRNHRCSGAASPLSQVCLRWSLALPPSSLAPPSPPHPNKQGSSPESCKTTLFLVGSSYFLFSTPPFFCPFMFLRWGAGEGRGLEKEKTQFRVNAEGS